MQQTAVEWLEDALAENLKDIILNSNDELMEMLFKQTKEMEKEQNIEFAKFFYELMTQKEIAKHIVEVIHFETFKK